MRYRANLIAVTAFSGLAASAAGWGWFDIGGIRPDSPGHATALIAGLIGFALSMPVLGSALATRARASAARAAPQGRWFAGPAEIAAFLDRERRAGTANEWRPTAGERAQGIAVCWAGETLLVGGHYWRIAPGQYPPIRAVEVRPGPVGSATLRYAQLWAHNMSSVPRLVPTEREFRFPAPDEAQARAMARHFAGLLGSEPARDRQRRHARLAAWAFGAAVVFLALLAIGFGFAWHDRVNGIFRPTAERAALIAITVLGIMGTPLMLSVGLHLRARLRD